MNRAVGAIGTRIVPGFMISFLLALGERDWFHCFAHAETSTPPPMPSLFAPGEFSSVLLETVTPPLSGWWLFALHFGPTAAFALLVLLARSPAQRRTGLAALALFLLWALWMLLPPSSQHACDAAGPDAMPILTLLVAVGTLAALLANKITCLSGACQRPDVSTPRWLF